MRGWDRINLRGVRACGFGEVTFIGGGHWRKEKRGLC